MKLILFLIIWGGYICSARAEMVQVAVASNFTAPMQQIAAHFERDTGHQARIVPGATGKLHAQIMNAAPFDLLLAADEESPAKLEQGGLSVPGSRFTYAQGKLVLWSGQTGFVDARGDILRKGHFPHLALANPKLASYGKAALETMTSLGLVDALQGKFVLGENIAQAHQFVVSGNAPLGFVAMGQVFIDGKLRSGSAWIVPADLYRPIRQDAVMLLRGKNNPAAQALLDYLKQAGTKALIRRFGYEA